MKADPVSYKRATSVSLIGLVIQLGITLALLLYGVFGRDATAISGFFYALVGIPVWVGLALVFQQHRLERLEAEEADLYATSSAAQASVFGEIESELRVAAKRLAWMHKMLLPVISVIVGGALIGLGYWRFTIARPGLELGSYSALSEMVGWAVSLGIGIAIVGFIFGRFVAGMAQESAWANLRAGAASMVGASLLGLALAIAHGAAFAGSERVLGYLGVAVPIVMMALGGEVFLNFVLNIYRPRRTGEVPRPAFDSRVLGFVAAPDRLVETINEAINYQFGFDVSSTWFYRLLRNSMAILTIFAVLIVWLMTTAAVVEPNEQGLKFRFGKLERVLDSGLALKMPWPFETVETFPARRLEKITIGSHPPKEGGAILWTQPHGVEEMFFLVQSVNYEQGARESGSGLSMLAIEAPLMYRVNDLVAYRMLAADGPADDPDAIRRRLLESVATEYMIEFAASHSVNQILGSGRAAMPQELRVELERRFAALGPVNPETGEPYGAGIELVSVGIAGAHPPYDEEVARSFTEVIAAMERSRAMMIYSEAGSMESLIRTVGDATLAQEIIDGLDEIERMRDRDAGESAILEQELRIQELIESAGGEAAVMIASARADRWQLRMRQQEVVTRQAGRSALHSAAPGVFMAVLYFNTWIGAVEDARIFLTPVEPGVNMNFEELQTNIQGFESKSATQE